jgi:prepilin-type processing-associated H-X9-DG protein
MFRRAAFTTIELLVVIAIVAILFALLFPAVQRARQMADRAQCANHLRQLGIACHQYHDSTGSFPPGYTADPNDSMTTAPGWGWAVYLLPHIEQTSLFGQLDMTKPVEDPANALAIQSRIGLFTCPAEPALPDSTLVTDPTGTIICRAAPCSYAATVGDDSSEVDAPDGNGIFYRNSQTRISDITDGTSYTVMLGDRAWAQTQGIWAGAVNGSITRAGTLNPWPNAVAPAEALVLVHNNWLNVRTDTDGGLDDFSSNHPGGANLLFADGSVHFIQDISMDGQLRRDFWALGTRAAGDEIRELDY